MQCAEKTRTHLLTKIEEDLCRLDQPLSNASVTEFSAAIKPK